MQNSSYEVGKFWEPAKIGSPQVLSKKAGMKRHQPWLLHALKSLGWGLGRQTARRRSRPEVSRGRHTNSPTFAKSSWGRIPSNAVHVAICKSGMATLQFCFPFECFSAHSSLQAYSVFYLPKVSSPEVCSVPRHECWHTQGYVGISCPSSGAKSRPPYQPFLKAV